MRTPGRLADRFPLVLDAWFAYLEDNPYAAKLLFADTTGDPDVQAVYRDNHAAARTLTIALLKAEPELGIPDDHIEPLAEFIRSGTTGLALWWADHPGVPRSTVVEVTVDMLLHGLGLAPAGDR
jgi:hypothetical protein